MMSYLGKGGHNKPPRRGRLRRPDRVRGAPGGRRRRCQGYGEVCRGHAIGQVGHVWTRERVWAEPRRVMLSLVSFRVRRRSMHFSPRQREVGQNVVVEELQRSKDERHANLG